MKFDLSNKVIARLSNSDSQSPNRSLDLGNIITPELSLLSPNRNEIAPRGGGRDAALIAYSERLRSSYKQNEGGLRDGMVLLSEAFRNGQPISITCFCRAGQTCHADVVKLAIEKVAKAIDAKELNHAARSTSVQDASFRPSNPRTERAINEIISVSKSDLLLSKLDDTNGRNRSEHASFLNAESQFLRDTYERGGTVQNGVLIIPKESHDLKSPLQLATLGYGVGRLEALVGSEKAREAAPRILEYGKTIAGSNADRETDAKVFRWIYDSLDGKQELLDQVRDEAKSESVVERFDRTLAEIAKVADEMERLEPSDRSMPYEQLVESNSQNMEHSFGEEPEEIAESSEHLSTERDPEHGQTTLGFERIELESTHLNLLATEMSVDELKHWSEVKFPALNEALENGIPPSTILKLFRAKSDKTIENGVKGKELDYEDLRFATAYLEHQLKQPETRLRHFNERYRDYAQMLDRCQSREEVIEASSKIRIENASVGFNRQQDGGDRKPTTSPALTSNEMQMLFTEQSPRHFTSEMTVAKLSHAGDGAATKARTEALKRGEIAPSPEALQLVNSLESRMERKYLDESLSATKHFLQSLKTPNEELRYKNSFDHSELYRKLPPAERDFVYQRATEQKDHLETTARSGSEKRDLPTSLVFEGLREEMKRELLDLSLSNVDSRVVLNRTTVIFEEHLGNGRNNSLNLEAQQLSQELSEIVVGRNARNSQHERDPSRPKVVQEFKQSVPSRDHSPVPTR
ncbi:MAG: hypothetical protein AB7Q37_17475 [Pyrinomonadaceae bacterium]